MRNLFSINIFRSFFNYDGLLLVVGIHKWATRNGLLLVLGTTHRWATFVQAALNGLLCFYVLSMPSSWGLLVDGARFWWLSYVTRPLDWQLKTLHTYDTTPSRARQNRPRLISSDLSQNRQMAVNIDIHRSLIIDYSWKGSYLISAADWSTFIVRFAHLII